MENTGSKAKRRTNDVSKRVIRTVRVDPKYRKFFFNCRAQLIRKVSKENGGVSIHFPRERNSNNVLLAGAGNFVHRAKLAIMEVLTDIDSQVVVLFNVPREHHGELKGAKGINLQLLSEEYNVVIEFPPHEVNGGEGTGMGTGNDGDAIMITGKEENCLKVKQALLDLVPREIVVDVPRRFHGAIVGSRGRNVSAMRHQYSVKIKVPPARRKRGRVIVRGRLHNCIKAKEALLERVEQIKLKEKNRAFRAALRSQSEAVQVPSEDQIAQDETVVEVPLRFHRAIIGERSENIRSICRQFDVWIFTPLPHIKKDYFRVQGTVSNRERAKEALLKSVEQLQEEEGMRAPEQL